MKAIYLMVVLGGVAVACGLPMGESGKNLVTGVFIPSDAFKNLQDRANANSNQQPSQGNVQNIQPTIMPNPQPTYQQVQPNQPVLTNQQPQNVQPTVVTQPQVLTNQPGMNQPTNLQPAVMANPTVVYTQPMTANRDPNSGNQPVMVMTNQPSAQPNQPIMLVQQPSNNQPIYVQQPNPSQGYILSNNQPGQQVILTTNPSNGNQVQGTLVSSPNQNQPGTTIYTLIPLNTQNNMNSNPTGTTSYLIPVQSGNSNPIILSTGQ